MHDAFRADRAASAALAVDCTFIRKKQVSNKAIIEVLLNTVSGLN